MSGESQYFNPIVEAMMGSVANQQRQQQLEQQAQQIKQAQQQFQGQQAIEKIRQATLDRETDIHQQQMEYQRQQAQDMLTKVHLPMLQAQIEANHQAALENFQKMLANGAGPEAANLVPGLHYNPGSPGDLQPGFPQPPPIVGIPQNQQPVQPPQSATISSDWGNSAPVNSIYDPAQLAGRTRLLAAAQSGGEAQGQQPYVQANTNLQYQHALALQANTQKYGADQQQARLDAEAAIKKYDVGAQFALHAQDNRARFELAGLGINPDDPSSGSGYVPQTLVDLQTGKVKYNPKDPIQRAANGAMSKTPDIDGLTPRPLDPKEAEELKQLNTMPAIFDQMRKLADRFPDETSEGSTPATVHALWQSHVANSQFSTDLKRDTENIQTQLVPVARALEGATGGRILSKQLETEVGGMVAPGQTKQQAYQKIQTLQDTLVNQEKNKILSGLPISQQHLIQKTYGLQPVGSTPTPTPRGGHTIRVGGKLYDYNGSGDTADMKNYTLQKGQ